MKRYKSRRNPGEDPRKSEPDIYVVDPTTGQRRVMSGVEAANYAVSLQRLMTEDPTYSNERVQASITWHINHAMRMGYDWDTLKVRLSKAKRGEKSNPRKNPEWTEAELFEFLRQHPGGITVKEFVYGFGGYPQGHQARLEKLVERGVLKRERWARGGDHYLLSTKNNPGVPAQRAGQSALTGEVFRVTSCGSGGEIEPLPNEADRKDFKREGEARRYARTMATKYGKPVPIIRYLFSKSGSLLHREHWTSEYPAHRRDTLR